MSSVKHLNTLWLKGCTSGECSETDNIRRCFACEILHGIDFAGPTFWPNTQTPLTQQEGLVCENRP